MMVDRTMIASFRAAVLRRIWQDGGSTGEISQIKCILPLPLKKKIQLLRFKDFICTRDRGEKKQTLEKQLILHILFYPPPGVI